MFVDTAMDCIDRLDRQIEVATADAIKSSRVRLQHVVFNAIRKESVAKVPAARVFLLERVQEICRRRERLFRVLEGIRQSLSAPAGASSSGGDFGLDWLSAVPDGGGRSAGGAPRPQRLSSSSSLVAVHRDVTRSLHDADELCTLELVIGRGGSAGDDVERIELFEPLLDPVESSARRQENRTSDRDDQASSDSESHSSNSGRDDETAGKRREVRGAASSSYDGTKLGALQRLTEDEYLAAVAFPMLPLDSLGKDVPLWTAAAAGVSHSDKESQAGGDDENEASGGTSLAKGPSPRLLGVMTHIAERLAIRQALADLRNEPRIAAPRRHGPRAGVHPNPTSQSQQPVFPLRLACASESLAYCVLQLYASAVAAEVQRRGLEATMGTLLRLCADESESSSTTNVKDSSAVAEQSSDPIPPLPIPVRRYIAKYALPRGSDLSKHSPSARNLVRTFFEKLRV